MARSYTVGLGRTTALPDTVWSSGSVGTGTLAQVGNTLRPTVPVDFQFTVPTAVDFLFSAQYTLSGQLVGQTPFIAVEVPEPATWALWMLGAAALGAAVRRRAELPPAAGGTLRR